MTTLRTATVLLGLLIAMPPIALLGQAPPRSVDSACFRARPAPECRVFFLTNAGAFVAPQRGVSGMRYRAIVDWGVMLNGSSKHAIGASLFVTLDDDDLTAGPALRYRRWLSNYRSLDVALGTVATEGELKAGSVLGLLKYNPVHWFGVGIRPEYLRRTAFNCDSLSCTPYTATSARVYGGAEFGWTPGVVLTIGGGVVLGLLILALSAAG